MKWLRKHFDTCFTVLQVWVDGIVILFSCALAYYFVQRVIPDSVYQVRVYSQLVVLITGVTLSCFWLFGMYKWRKSILNVEEYRNTFKATVMSFLVTTMLVFLLREATLLGDQNVIYRVLGPLHEMLELKGTENYSRLLVVVIYLLIFGLTLLQRAIFFKAASALHARGYGNTYVAIFGTGPLALRVQQKLKLFPTLGYKFLGFLDDDERLHGRQVRGFPVLGGRSDLAEVVTRHQIKRILVASPDLEEDELVELCRACEDIGVEYQVVPRLYHFFSQRFTIDKLDSIPLITISDRRGQPIYLGIKRLIDIAVASIVLTLAAPLMLLVALLIKRESKGPIFFTQLRVGQNGRTIRIIKFRTMYVEMCGDEVSPSHSHDPRVTRIGRFLRGTSIDEIPQFWNVLIGEMSLVGPRPEMPFIVDTYTAVDRLRLEAKPGITGLWQISEARRDPIHENLDYDLYYIENQSTFLDTVIILMTLFAVFRGRGAV